MSKKTKQISYMSAIVISVGSTIGAGIFFKNGTVFANAGGSLIFTIVSWLVAAIGILAIGFALVEITSANKTKGGVVDWVKKFLPKRFAKYSASYMLFVYLPLTYFAMPIYAVQTLQDAIGIKMAGWEVMGIAFAFFTWISIMAYFRLKIAEKVQWVFTIMKFLPLFIVPILAMVGIGQTGVVTTVMQDAKDPITGKVIQVAMHTPGLTSISPWLGIMASIPAILFAMDGFYTVSSMDLKDDKKLGSIMAVSISIIASVYLFFAIFLGLDGASSAGAVKIVADNKWLGVTINVIIIMAILGISNGYAMAGPNIYHTFHEDGYTGIVRKTHRLFKFKNTEDAAWASTMLLTIIAFLILTPVSIYAWNPTELKSVSTYGATSAPLYEMTDLVTNFTSLMLFMFIGLSIFGGLINRKTKKVKVTKKKYFIPAGTIAVVFLAIGIIYMITSYIYNISANDDGSRLTDIVKFAIFGATALGSFIPTYWDKIWPRSLKKSII